MDKISQKKIFLESEGDKWFERNLPKYELERKTIPAHIQFIDKYIKNGYKILEIGCSTGIHLHYFQRKPSCQCYGIDPSQEAIEYGRKDYKELNLSVGTSDSLQFLDGYFDFILFGFCLYLVDRNYLVKSIAEADRVLKDKGYVAIIDFDTNIPKKRPYKHYKGIFSYKLDYSKLFLAFPHYSLVEKMSFSHSTDSFVEDIKERVSAVVLYKDLNNAYILEEDN